MNKFNDDEIEEMKTAATIILDLINRLENNQIGDSYIIINGYEISADTGYALDFLRSLTKINEPKYNRNEIIDILISIKDSYILTVKQRDAINIACNNLK